MTDYEKWMAFLNEFNVGYEEVRDEKYNYLTLVANEHRNVRGYAGFTADIFFNAEGKFIEVGVWE